jgi:hypothetical protein
MNLSVMLLLLVLIFEDFLAQIALELSRRLLFDA